ncbi:hypothetical protein MASR2M48_04320 [Spirochaetota bacterium]
MLGVNDKIRRLRRDEHPWADRKKEEVPESVDAVKANKGQTVPFREGKLEEWKGRIMFLFCGLIVATGNIFHEDVVPIWPPSRGDVSRHTDYGSELLFDAIRGDNRGLCDIRHAGTFPLHARTPSTW